MRIFVIDSNIDDMGGVERIVNILSNSLSSFYNVRVISEYKTRKDPFFKYNSIIKRDYLIRDIKFLRDNTRFKHYFNRLVSIMKEKLFLKKKIVKFLRTISEDDILIFGRVTVALDFLPLIKKYGLNNRVIVRDGTHLVCYNHKTRELMSKYFPDLIDTFVVSSDESIVEYQSFFGDCRMKLSKVYNPLGIKVNFGYEPESKIIVSVGRICTQKGFEALIDAFSIVLKKHPDWVLKLYGNGDLENKIRARIDKLGISNNAQLLNSVEDVVGVYNKSAIFVCSSRFEGYANALVEAGACGLPLVSFDWLMGVEEIIRENKNGIIVRLFDRYDYFNGNNNEKDISNMAEAINQLIENKNKRLEFSLNNKKLFKNRDLDKIIKQWIHLIER